MKNDENRVKKIWNENFCTMFVIKEVKSVISEKLKKCKHPLLKNICWHVSFSAIEMILLNLYNEIHFHTTKAKFIVTQCQEENINWVCTDLNQNFKN